MRCKHIFCFTLVFVLSVGLLASLHMVGSRAPGLINPVVVRASGNSDVITPNVEIIAPDYGDLLTQTQVISMMTYHYLGTNRYGTMFVGSTVSVTMNRAGNVTSDYREASYITDTFYAYTWTLPLEDHIPYTITARIYDPESQQTGISDPLRVYIDTQPPTVSLTLPPYTEEDTFTVFWRMEDGSGEVSYTLKYRRDDQMEWTDWLSGTSYLTQTDEMSDTFAVDEVGYTYQFWLQAHDRAGNSSEITKSIRVGKWQLYMPLVLRNYPPRFDYVDLSIDESHTYDAEITVNLSAGVIGDRIQRIGLRNEGETEWTIHSVVSATDINQSFTWPLPDATQLHTIEAIAFGETITSAIASASVYYVPNGSFEEAELVNWEITTAPLPASRVDTTVGHPGSTGAAEGAYMLLLGDPTYSYNNVPLGYVSAVHTFDVPADGSKPKLFFKYIIWTQDRSISGNYDRFEVYVNNDLVFFDGNQNPTQGDKWWRVPSPQNPRNDVTSGWATKTIDLSDYAGKEITVSFENHSRYDGWYNTYTYIDDVHITGGW